MDDLISRKALLSAYDNAHKGPPGNARRLIEEAPAVISDYEDVGDVDFLFLIEALKRNKKKHLLGSVFIEGKKFAICPTCKKFVRESVNFCPYCGQAMIRT